MRSGFKSCALEPLLTGLCIDMMHAVASYIKNVHSTHHKEVFRLWRIYAKPSRGRHIFLSLIRRGLEEVITGKRTKTIEYRFCEARNENNESKERAYRATHDDYVFGRGRTRDKSVTFLKFNMQRYRRGHNGADSKSVCG